MLTVHRKGMRELATALPEIDQFSFMANDSGSGLNWATASNGSAKNRRMIR